MILWIMWYIIYSILPLLYRPNIPLPYATHLLPTFPLLNPRIPSTPLISSALIPYHTLPSPLLPYPPLQSLLFSHLPLSPPLAYPTLPSPLVYPALPKDSEKVKGQDVLVPECIGAEIVWCKTSFEGLKWPSAWKVHETCRAETSWGRIVFGSTLTFV